MATVFRRAGSPFWYAKFNRGGEPVVFSTKTTVRREAVEVLNRKMKEVDGVRTVDEAARAYLDVVGVSVAAEENAQARLLRTVVDQATPEDVVTALMGRIKQLATGVEGKPMDAARLHEDRRRWSRIIGGASAIALPLDKAWAAWLRAPRRRGAGESTLEGSYKPIWRRFHAWATGRGLRHLHDITPIDAIELLSYLKEQSLAPKTIKAHRAFLLEMWSTLRTQAGLADNVWKDTPAPDGEPSMRRALADADIQRLFAAAGSSEERVAIALGLFTGMRLGDAANLKWSSVDLERGVLRFRPLKTRRYGRDLSIPIHPSLKEELLRHREAAPESEWVCGELQALYDRSRGLAGRKMNLLFTRAGITLTAPKEGSRRRAPSLGTYHALRHTFITRAAQAGVPQMIVREIVGHSNAETTRLYEHADDASLSKAIASIPPIRPASPPANLAKEFVHPRPAPRLAPARAPGVRTT